MLFWINVLLGLFGTIAAGQTILENLSPEEISQFFGTPDGIVPDYHLITFDVSSRIKRTPSHEVEIKLNLNGTLSRVTLSLVQDNYLIGAKRTGIFLATSKADAFNSVSYEPDPTRLSHIGDISFYQNIEDGSALTYFHRSRIFTGVLRENWVLKPLPESSLDEIVTPVAGHAVKMRSVGSEEDESENFEGPGPLHALFYIGKVSHKHSRRRKGTNMVKQIRNRKKQHGGKSRTWQRSPTVFYPKLLMIVDYGLLMKKTHFLEYLISFFNVVDMTYRRINDPFIRINIAGIVMPQDSGATPYLAPDTTVIPKYNADTVLDRIGEEFYFDNKRFPIDRYDIAMIMTEKSMFQLDEKEYRQPLEGLSLMETACYRSDAAEVFEETPNAGAAIFQYDSIFGGVSTMSHELGHILGVDHDVACLEGDRCMMSEDYTDSLDWSASSKEAFKAILNLSYADAYCLQSPVKEIASALKDKKGAWLPLDGMCANLYTTSSGSCVLRGVKDICNGFGCLVNGQCEHSGRKPWDGADCGNGKTCQNSRCV